MDSSSKPQETSSRRLVIVVLLLGLIGIVCAGAIYYVGDLSKLQTAVSAEESRAALRDVTGPEQLDQAIKQYPSNRLLRLLALANRDATEIDAATQELLSEVEAKPLPKLGDLGASGRGDLDALRKDLKTAEGNAASFAPRYAALIKTTRDKVENEARAVNAGDESLSDFMAMIDEQHAAWAALTSKLLAARADYYDAYDKCVGLLTREFGIYRVSNGQFVFPFQSTADAYNRTAAAMTAAAKQESELDGERRNLRQSQLGRWKAFAEH